MLILLLSSLLNSTALFLTGQVNHVQTSEEAELKLITSQG